MIGKAELYRSSKQAVVSTPKKGLPQKIRALGLLFSLVPAMIIAAERPLVYRRLNIAQGLSQNSVNTIVQDDAGFIWMGTQDGLNRYDGFTFTVFKQAPGMGNTLSHSYILCLGKGTNGMIWIGTEGGLNRLNPRTGHFIQYLSDPRTPDSLVSNRVLSVYESPATPGIVWVGTDHGLDRLDSLTGRCTHYGDILAVGGTAKNLNVRSISGSFQEPGIIWVGTSRGLKRLDPEKRSVVNFSTIPGNPNSLCHDQVHVVREFADQPGVFWVGTENGLDQFEPRLNRFTHFRSDPADPDTLVHSHIRVIYQSPREPNTLWLGTYGGGFSRLDRRTGNCRRYGENPADPNGLHDSFILSFFEDSSGMLWIGSEGGGLYYLEGKPRGFFHFRNISDQPDSLNNNMVRGICASRTDPDTVWIATFGGLNRMDRRTGKFTHYLSLPNRPRSLASNLIRSVYEDRNGVLWIGTLNTGLDRFDPRRGEFVHYRSLPDDERTLSHNYVRVINEDWAGNLWVGTVGGGLNRLAPDRRTITRFLPTLPADRGPSSNRIYAICPDQRNGVIWIGTALGLNEYNPSTGTFVNYLHDRLDAKSLSNNMVMSLCLDSRGRLWVGTWGGGLNLFDRAAKRFLHFSEKDGLSNNVVYGILEDRSGFLWLSSNYGLTRFHPETKSTHVFDIGDGLQSNEYNSNSCSSSATGVLYFGGLNGFDEFNPERIAFNTQPPPVRITSLQLFNRPVAVGEMVNGRVILPKPLDEMGEITLSHREKVIALEYTSLNYIQPEKNRFAYRMEGLEEEWNQVGNRRFAAYTTLPAGTYTFQVKAANNDGVWNDSGASIRLRILPPFWMTWWFLTLVAAAFFTGLTFTFRWRVSQIHRRKAELEEQVRERTQKLSEANLQLEQINEELKKLSIVASETDNAVMIMDSAGNFEWVNEGFVRLFGTLDELIRARGRNMLDASENPDIRNHFQRCLAEKRSVIYETLSQANNRQGIWMQTTLTPIIDDAGNIVKLIAIESNVHRIKTAEEEIRKQKELLNENNEKMALLNHELLRLATHDGLTGIANHRSFMEFFEQEWRRAQRNQRPLALIMADVDLFKKCNDEFGHQAGDHCLKMIARIMKEAVQRPTDLVARYGGEEFAVVLAETDLQGAIHLAERIRKEVCTRLTIEEEGRKLNITISLGCACFFPEKEVGSNQLLKAADRALYHAKESGRNRVSFVQSLEPISIGTYS